MQSPARRVMMPPGCYVAQRTDTLNHCADDRAVLVSPTGTGPRSPFS
jgi:hypothetical protein